ncbi:MAG: DnaJ domain-containing protein, partial [Pseudomonadota bacterium]|nr:DnaJ domain-containing protein [Pseudomonadota bacterium]
MSKVHSHYENLKVARDASAQDIRSAYRLLTRQYHPDRNPDNADAARVMAVVNVAYDVLSDPAKRRRHDAWIAEEESAQARPVRHATTLHRPTHRAQGPRPSAAS